METINQMEKRHEQEIGELQANCPHKKSEWMDSVGIPGCLGRVRVCLACGKTLESAPITDLDYVTVACGDTKWTVSTI